MTPAITSGISKPSHITFVYHRAARPLIVVVVIVIVAITNVLVADVCCLRSF